MRRTHQARLGALAAAVTAALPLIGLAQTSGSWVVNADGNWSLATNWNPNMPDGGGVATFNQLVNQNITRNTTLDVNISLSEIIYNSGPRWIIPATGTSILTMQGSGINPGILTSNISAPNSPSAFSFGPTIIRPIAGANGLTKQGAGNLTLQGTNTYTGGTNINAGMLLSTTGDAALGTGGAANAINMNGGIWAYATTAVTSARNVNLNSNGTFLTLAAGTFSGVFSGSGSFNKLFSSTMAFQAANTYTGASNFEADGTNGPWGQTLSGTVTFQNSGSALSTSAINSSATISLDNVTTNINGRLNPTAPVTLHGVGVAISGNAGASTTENLGAVTGTAGMSFFSITPNAAQGASLTMASFTRQNRSTQVYRATGLGNAAGANVGNIFLTANPALTGGGGAAGSQNISIMVGATGGATATNLGTDLVTYGATGVRPLSLAATEYRTTLGAGAATDNVRLAAATATAADETMNALILNGALTGANTLTLTSGMLLNNVAATHTANINFGSAEGIMHHTAGGTWGGVISGSNGITKSGSSDATFTGNSTYTGNTTLLAGTTRWNAVAIPANAAGPFGNSNDPIVIEPGGGVLARFWFSGVGGTQFDRPVIARGNGAGSAGFGVSGSQTITMNGSIALERQLDLEGSTTGLFDFNGVISGTGRLTDRFSSVSRFNAANTFSGGIEINTGSYFAGNDAGFGTGRIYMVGAGTIGASGAARTIANPITCMNAAFNIGSSSIVGVGGQNITFTGPVDLSGLASITFNVPANITARFDGAMSNGAIVKGGGGTMRVTAANPYVGGTIVNGGTLQVDNTSGSGTGAGAVVVNTGAFLSGVGLIADTVTMNAGSSLSPGDSPGTLTSGAMVLNNTTNLLYELSTPGFSASNDLMAVNGALTLDGVLTVTALATLQSGLYPLFTYSGVLTDNTVTINPLPQGGTGSIDTTTTPGVVYLNFTAVPEPATAGLFAVAAAGALVRRRRRTV